MIAKYHPSIPGLWSCTSLLHVILHILLATFKRNSGKILLQPHMNPSMGQQSIKWFASTKHQSHIAKLRKDLNRCLSEMRLTCLPPSRPHYPSPGNPPPEPLHNPPLQNQSIKSNYDLTLQKSRPSSAWIQRTGPSQPSCSLWKTCGLPSLKRRYERHWSFNPHIERLVAEVLSRKRTRYSRNGTGNV